MNVLAKKSVWIATAVLLTASGCEKEQPEIVQQIRAIKTFTVTEVASGQTRKFAGQVYATDSSRLSFQVSGNVKKMLVKQGDQVKKGQILAVLDKQPYRLDIKSAQAELQKARAEQTQARQEYRRQEALFKKGWVAKARLERVQRSRDSAASQVDYATSKLNLARRDLRLTDLLAPYDGTISRKHIDTFVEVKTGQSIYDIEALGALEVRFDVPETTISRVTVGMSVSVAFSSASVGPLQARITEVGSSAGTANAFPVKAGLTEPPSSVRSGMTAETTLLLADDGSKSTYLVPIAAIAPSDKPGEGFVFIFDSESKTIKRTPIKGKGATDNFAHIFEGVKAGDVVATAGVSFLRDGQKVKLLQQRSAVGLDASTSNR
jgi:RND family efflux transporter MFP subunit